MRLNRFGAVMAASQNDLRICVFAFCIGIFWASSLSAVEFLDFKSDPSTSKLTVKYFYLIEEGTRCVQSSLKGRRAWIGAEDLSTEVFLETLKKFRPESGTFETMFYLTLYRRLIDRVRRGEAYERRLHEWSNQKRTQFSDNRRSVHCDSEMIVCEIKRRYLQQNTRGNHKKNWELFELRYAYGVPVKVLAEWYGVSEHGIVQSISRCRDSLRALGSSLLP